jgi:hypothetical protein
MKDRIKAFSVDMAKVNDGLREGRVRSVLIPAEKEAREHDDCLKSWCIPDREWASESVVGFAIPPTALRVLDHEASIQSRTRRFVLLDEL